MYKERRNTILLGNNKLLSIGAKEEERKRRRGGETSGKSGRQKVETRDGRSTKQREKWLFMFNKQVRYRRHELSNEQNTSKHIVMSSALNHSTTTDNEHWPSCHHVCQVL